MTREQVAGPAEAPMPSPETSPSGRTFLKVRYMVRRCIIIKIFAWAMIGVGIGLLMFGASQSASVIAGMGVFNLIASIVGFRMAAAFKDKTVVVRRSRIELDQPGKVIVLRNEIERITRSGNRVTLHRKSGRSKVTVVLGEVTPRGRQRLLDKMQELYGDMIE